jgi:hypothetical protein
MNKRLEIAVLVLIIVVAGYSLIKGFPTSETANLSADQVSAVALSGGLKLAEAQDLINTLEQEKSAAARPATTGWIKMGNFSYYSSNARPARNVGPSGTGSNIYVGYSPLLVLPGGTSTHMSITLGYEVNDPYLEKLLARSGKAPLSYYISLMKKWGWDPQVIYVDRNTPVLTQSLVNDYGAISRYDGYAFWLTVNAQGKPSFVMLNYNGILPVGSTTTLPVLKNVVSSEMASNGLIKTYLQKYPNRLK